MNEQELKEIEARAEAATLGPWDIGHEAPPLYAGNSCITAKLGERMAIIFEANHNFDLDNSAAFIAHARQDVPALCEEVRRLRAALDKYADDKNWRKSWTTGDINIFDGSVGWEIAQDALKGGAE